MERSVDRVSEFVNRSKKEEMDVADAVDARFRTLLEEGPNVPADSNFDQLELPSYYEPKKFRLGQMIFFNNLFTMMIAKLAGLLILLSIPTVRKVLKFTKQSGTPCLAFRRYASTILHTFVWYDNTPDKQIRFFDSLKNVRRKHCIASRRSLAAGLCRISQLDMAFTQFGFIGFTLLNGEQLGLVYTEEELEGFVHVWRVIGNALGMEERFNICNGTVAEARALCRRLLDEAFLPCVTTGNKDFKQMSRVLLEGLWPINPSLNPDAFTAFTLHLAASATANNNHSIVIDTSSMSLYSRFLLSLQLFVHRNLMQTTYWWSSIFRSFFNVLMRISIFLTENFPFLAYWTFGRKQSHVDIYKVNY